MIKGKKKHSIFIQKVTESDPFKIEYFEKATVQLKIKTGFCTPKSQLLQNSPHKYPSKIDFTEKVEP